MRYKKFDLHCHTAEGSTDSSLSVRAYAELLQKMGFAGMLVTDHNSYEGFRAWQKEQEKPADFTVLRGIEYDTFDYGHIIVILPTDTPRRVYKLLSHRGMQLASLVKVVHAYGGILGPAHPGGEPFLSFAKTGYWRKKRQQSFMSQFDFIEGFNACEPQASNDIAVCLANRFRLPMTGGSDAHRANCAGLGYTYLPEQIRSEDELIAWYQRGHRPTVGGVRYGKTLKDKLGQWNLLLVMSFFFYNKTLAFWHTPARLRHARRI